MSSLVIGYDPTDRAKRACATGTKLAGALGAELHLVTAFEERSDGGSFETFKLESLLDQVGSTIELLSFDVAPSFVVPPE
jgi:hypothetical protein